MILHILIRDRPESESELPVIRGASTCAAGFRTGCIPMYITTGQWHRKRAATFNSTRFDSFSLRTLEFDCELGSARTFDVTADGDVTVPRGI